MTCVEALSHVVNCKVCLLYIAKIHAQKGGSSITEKKQAAARLNGLKGGRPKKMEQR